MKKILPIISITFCWIFIHAESMAQQQLTGAVPAPSRKRQTQSQQKQTPFEGSISYTDTVNKVVRELTKEFPADKNALIKIINTTRNIEIRTWPEAKVKIVAAISVEEKKAATVTEEELMQIGGLTFKSFGNRVEVQSTNLSLGDYPIRNIKVTSPDGQTKFYSTPGELTSFYTDHQAQLLAIASATGWSTVPTKKMTVYVPDSCRLDVDNKYMSILITNDITEGRFKMSRGNLDARNFRKLNIIADLYNVNISDVDEAELELENGSLTAGAMRTVDLDSKSSEIDYEGGDQLYLRSQSDRIIVDEVAKVDGRKTYGDLRIGKLLKAIDIEGTNADIKIRTITADVEAVKINDKYADLRLPVKGTPNFLVNFKGDNSTVFAPFEQKMQLELKLVSFNTEELKAELISGKNLSKNATHGNLSEEEFNKIRLELMKVPAEDKMKYVNAVVAKYDKLKLGQTGPTQFKGSGGDTTGKHTVFNITCNQCTVDFK